MLASISQLDLDKIIENIDLNHRLALSKDQFAIFDKIGSTNTYLLGSSKLPNNKLMFCISNIQTAGRGRINRTWISPPGNIYLSILWHFNLNVQQLSGLNIATAIAVENVLSTYGAKNIHLKWPNDLLYKKGKLAGILIETISNPQSTIAILGIGINLINPILPEENLIFMQIESLNNIIKKNPDRNSLIGKLITEILNTLHRFAELGLEKQTITTWQQKDYTLNKLISIQTGKQAITGINRGIDRCGNLLLERVTYDNLNIRTTKDILKLQTISSGEIDLVHHL